LSTPDYDIRLDHFYGRTVTGIQVDSDDDSAWAIQLEGELMIINLDTNRITAPPNEIIGMAFLLVALGGNDGKDTRMMFGRNGQVLGEVTLTAAQYSISGPELAVDVYPQRISDEEKQMLVDVAAVDLSEREQETPSQEWLDAHPEEAAEMGLSVSENAQEATNE
jgi:hypothetical protein